MKRLFFFLLLFLATLASAQNVLVKYYPDNQPYQGLTNYPAQIQPATNYADGVGFGWSTNMSNAEFSAYLQPLLVQYYASKSNADYWVSYSVRTNNDAHYAAWFQIYTNLPLGLVDATARTNALYQVYMSLVSGTNNQTQVNAHVKTLAQNLWISFIYQRQIIEYLSRLGPGFGSIYDPSKDPLQ